ncbi:hypothetical protein ACWD7T_17725 [Streptomyces sp. 900116325]|uniref:hypothetical protein n=1 Tax=Streptomyces sp. NPDC005525 TaxID=3364720 RepID=UPI0036AB03F2
MAVKTIWSITFACGHHADRDLSDRAADRRAGFAEWLAKQSCTDCWHASKEDDEQDKAAWRKTKRAEEQAESEAWSEQYLMPPLEGTERAVAWGLRCRHQVQVGMSRACRRVRMAPAKAGAWPAARMARRAAGPEMLAPAWRSVWRALRVSAVARAVSMSRRSWMPSRLRDIGGVGYWNSLECLGRDTAKQ